MPVAPRLDPERHAAFQIVALANRISSSASRIYLRDFGVGVMEWRVLALAALRPAISAAEISQMSGVDKSPVSRAIQTLVGRGLMQARGDAGDNRRILLSLTASGEALHDRIIEVSLERDDQLLAGLSAAERAALFGLFRRLAANLAAAEAAPGVQSGRLDPI